MSFMMKPKLVNCHTVFFAELECSSLWILSRLTFDLVVDAGSTASAYILPHPRLSKSSAGAQRNLTSFPFRELRPLASVTSSLRRGPPGRARGHVLGAVSPVLTASGSEKPPSS